PSTGTSTGRTPGSPRRPAAWRWNGGSIRWRAMRPRRASPTTTCGRWSSTAWRGRSPTVRPGSPPIRCGTGWSASRPTATTWSRPRCPPPPPPSSASPPTPPVSSTTTPSATAGSAPAAPSRSSGSCSSSSSARGASLVAGPGAPGRAAGRIEERGRLAALDGGEGHLDPQPGAGQRLGQPVAGEEADVEALQRVGLELTAGHLAVEDQRVQRHRVEPEPHPVEDGEERDGLGVDAGLLLDLLDRHLRRRVADVGPARRVEPHARPRPLDEEDLAGLVADHRPDGRLRRDVAGHALPHARQPLLDLDAGLDLLQGVVADVGGDPEDLLEALALVEVLREPEAGAGAPGQGLRPAQQVAGGDEERLAGRAGGGVGHGAATLSGRLLGPGPEDGGLGHAPGEVDGGQVGVDVPQGPGDEPEPVGGPGPLVEGVAHDV